MIWEQVYGHDVAHDTRDADVHPHRPGDAGEAAMRREGTAERPPDRERHERNDGDGAQDVQGENGEIERTDETLAAEPKPAEAKPWWKRLL